VTRVAGSVAARPAIISEKKMPIDRDMPEFWKVAPIPDAEPRSRAGTLLIMAEVFGEANRPEPSPLPRMMSVKAQYGKSTGSSISPVNASALSGSPEVANGRGPYRSGQVPGDRARDEEPGGQREHVDARPQRRVREVVAVQREPDALQPDDQAAAGPDRAARQSQTASRPPSSNP
jgi:hypothetical protein